MIKAVFFHFCCYWAKCPKSLNKLGFLPNKSKNLIITHHLGVVWEKIWSKNFGPMGHPWGRPGSYLPEPYPKYFPTYFFWLPYGSRKSPWWPFSWRIIFFLRTVPATSAHWRLLLLFLLLPFECNVLKKVFELLGSMWSEDDQKSIMSLTFVIHPTITFCLVCHTVAIL